MPVLIKVTQNKNDQSAAFGKWYGRVVSTKTMSYQELCKHMSEHNSVYGEDVCLGVANKLQNCMLEQLLEGKKVQFGELGTFYLSVKSTGANKEGDYNLGVNIQGLYLCFAPSRTDVNNLSSKMLKKKATPSWPLISRSHPAGNFGPSCPRFPIIISSWSVPQKPTMTGSTGIPSFSGSPRRRLRGGLTRLTSP